MRHVATIVLVFGAVAAVTLLFLARNRPAGGADQLPTTLPAKEGFVQARVYNSSGQLVGPIEIARVVKSDEEWQKTLTKDQYEIARAKGTERPFCGNLLDNHKEGVYACVCCGLPLFESGSKFNSGTGWPSFFKPVAPENVIYHKDGTLGMERTEILCARCDCHLGHVFDDGPRPTGLRYCVNSESLVFVDKADIASKLADPNANQPTTQPAATPVP